MPVSIDLFWSFRSPYCYLALDRFLELTRTYSVEVNVRPVYPLAIRSPEFFTRVHPNYRRYHLLDSRRLAEFLGIPYLRPIPDPVVQDLETSRIAPEQPYSFGSPAWAWQPCWPCVAWGVLTMSLVFCGTALSKGGIRRLAPGWTKAEGSMKTSQFIWAR